MYRQILDPIGGSLALSAAVAAIPLGLLLTLLGVFRVRSDVAAACGLLTALTIAAFAYRMPVTPALSGAAQGAAFGLFPIVWIMLNAVWLNRLIDASGLLAVIRQTFAALSPDRRVQALVLAFCFGALLEALAGFGAPVAVVTAILIGLGHGPVRAATVAMFADAGGTAFGSMGNPITALAKATNLPAVELGRMVGRQSAIVAAFLPVIIVVVLDGRRGLRELWPIAVVTGLGFAAGQFVTSNHLAYPLSDLVGALAATGAAVVLLRLWSPATAPALAPEDPESPGRSPAAGLRAFTPYLLLVVLLALVSLDTPVSRAATRLGVRFSWPGVRVADVHGRPLGLAAFAFDWPAATGTILLLTGLISTVILRLPARTALREYGRAAARIRRAATTVVLVMALAYLMNYSGQAATIGTWLAGAGGAFVLLSPVLGWLGVAATGSDTSANALFGAVQVAAAGRIGVGPVLLAATNSEAGVLGKLVSPQNLAMAAAVAGMAGREGVLFRRTFPWSVACLAGFTVLVALMAAGPLSWMVLG
ncbi:L-lactate permease [Actinoallomurus rhizosphaericola]|uniref:L-lactate permease n=1 Tax=Actinoallomurus rhizosphaericola TaxID=2952536 RepID=UPI00209296DD|nr:L-lactate permease [Actinoallomurus rhizosphaericola]MCO5995506.1 L-lactate permease [Actinoallomurus rhizosphaericola]